MPSWITFTSSGTETQTITLSPTDGTAIGTHDLRVIFTSTNGPDPEYIALTITVTCEVTSITPPSAPTTNLEYIVYDPTNNYHDFTNAVYTQVPDC